MNLESHDFPLKEPPSHPSAFLVFFAREIDRKTSPPQASSPPHQAKIPTVRGDGR